MLWRQQVGILWEEAGTAAVHTRAGRMTMTSVSQLETMGTQTLIDSRGSAECMPARVTASLMYVERQSNGSER